MQKTLYSLIELQEIDYKLDKVIEERGDLPQIVDDLKTRIETSQELLKEQNGKIKNLTVETNRMETELESYREQLKKYEEQLYQVKTNKEYDAIANETENVKQKINEIEDKVLENSETIENLKKSNTDIEAELTKIKSEYEENNAVLKDRISASSEEENILRQERQIVEKNLTTQQISSYRRIREAKKGKAVASCNGGVCSGCFSFIPPQKVVEIKSMKNLYQCESCGRILVWDQNLED